MEKFIAGLALGMAGGALVVANSSRTRTLVKKSQDEIIAKVDAYIDEKLAGFNESAEKSKTKESK